MSSPGSVDRDERLRLFLALRLPDDVVASIAEWQSRELVGRAVGRSSARESPRHARVPRLSPCRRAAHDPPRPRGRGARCRSTELRGRPLARAAGRGDARAQGLHRDDRRQARGPGAGRARRPRPLPAREPRLAAARHRAPLSRPAAPARRSCPSSGRSCRPRRLLIYPVCTRPGRSTRCSNRFH